MRIPLYSFTTLDETTLYQMNQFLINLAAVLNGGIEFGTVNTASENIYCHVTPFTAAAVAGDEFSVPHSLNKVPTGYWVISRSASGIVYDGVTPNTATTLYLRCNYPSMTGTLIII